MEVSSGFCRRRIRLESVAVRGIDGGVVPSRRRSPMGAARIAIVCETIETRTLIDCHGLILAESAPCKHPCETIFGNFLTFPIHFLAAGPLACCFQEPGQVGNEAAILVRNSAEDKARHFHIRRPDGHGAPRGPGVFRPDAHRQGVPVRSGAPFVVSGPLSMAAIGDCLHARRARRCAVVGRIPSCIPVSARRGPGGALTTPLRSVRARPARPRRPPHGPASDPTDPRP